MSRSPFWFSFAGLALASQLAIPTASAHIRLSDPVARYEIQGFDTGIKSCPCGLGGSNRTCNVAVDGSDDNRLPDRVTTAEAGSTLTLHFEEYVNHTGRYRVAFDPDGADLADFNQNILVDIPDAANDNTGVPGQWEIEVQLPDTPCDNCTLQLVQAMEVDTQTAIPDPAPISSYYACIDLRLVAPGTPIDDATPADEAIDSEDMDSTDPADPPASDDPAPSNDDDGSGETFEVDAPSDTSPVGQSADEMATDTDLEMGEDSPLDTAMPALMAGTNAPASTGEASSSSSGGCSMPFGAAHGSGAALTLLGLAVALGRRRNR